MKRIERIEHELKGLKDREITATALADMMGLSRANVSSDLNKLCEKGIVEKNGSKPVFYKISRAKPKQEQLAFDPFLEINPSLLNCGRQAEAAVLYPPNGMHMMLLGETGVGKSMFAQLIFEYAVARGRIENKNSFIAFNCADYANTPQLLVSQLFGVQKGAYTGAESDRPGLIEMADGGILFLDEVHRLPPEGQEVLFTYIDRGVFRRVGETTNERQANVLLICATTERPESTMLKTFIRRIPMIIRIPSLEERTLDERLQLVSNFLMAESRRIMLPVNITLNSMRALFGYHCPGNAGQLKSDIQLLCARAYANYMSGVAEGVCINSFSLPAHIRNGIFAEQHHRQIWSKVSGINKRFLIFDGQSGAVPEIFGNTPSDIYRLIEQRTSDMKRVGMCEEDIQRELTGVLDQYYEWYREGRNDTIGLERFVGPEIIATVDRMIKKSSQMLRYIPNENIRCGIALHLNNAIQRIRQGHAIVYPNLAKMKAEKPELYSFGKECLDIMEQDFNIRLPEDEAGFLALFFAQPQDSAPRQTVQIIVAAHGTGTATSIAETVNRLVNSQTAKGFDAPLEEPPGYTYERIKNYLAAIPNVKEAFLLVDMGSLGGFAQELERDLKIRAKRFVLASTLHVLEAARKATLGYSIDDILDSVKNIHELALADGAYTKETTNMDIPLKNIEDIGILTQSLHEGNKLYILAVCTTGEGGARVIKEFLSSRLNLPEGLCEIITAAASDPESFKIQVDSLNKTGRIICVISSFTTFVPAEHFELSKVFDGSAIEQIQQIADSEAAFLQIGKSLSSMIQSLDIQKVSVDVREMIEKVRASLKINLSGEVLIGAFCHIACLLEALKRGGAPHRFSASNTIAAKYAQEVKHIKQECESLAKKYGVEIPFEEVCRITAFFVRENLLNNSSTDN